LKPPRFEYRRPTTVEEAVAELAEDPEGSRVLAGGQSLVLEMNYRRVRPARLVDVNHVSELDLLMRDGAGLRVGALARHASFEHGPGDGPLGRLLSRVSRHIAHPPIRSRGTMIGSLAYAHPAAEWPAVVVALDAELTLVSAVGARTVDARSFFEGPFATACRPGELVSEVRLPLLADGAGVGFVEHRRTQASFAVVAAVAVIEVADGAVSSARLAVAGGADRPLRAADSEALLIGAPADRIPFAAAAAAVAAGSSPRAEPHYSADYRRHVVDVVVRRALEAAARDGESRWS
jgi:aerobic carbon-monoxide dehydrogenase medium subunit